jgi:hypothetical protein
MPEGKTRFLLAYLFGGEHGRTVATQIDGKIDKLPGLRGLGLVTRAVTRGG